MYTCKTAFTSITGTFYRGKQNIPAPEFNALPVEERAYFFFNSIQSREPVINLQFNAPYSTALEEGYKNNEL